MKRKILQDVIDEKRVKYFDTRNMMDIIESYSNCDKLYYCYEGGHFSWNIGTPCTDTLSRIYFEEDAQFVYVLKEKNEGAIKVFVVKIIGENEFYEKTLYVVCVSRNSENVKRYISDKYDIEINKFNILAEYDYCKGGDDYQKERIRKLTKEFERKHNVLTFDVFTSIKEKENATTCEGCRLNLANQQGHMGHGGCLADY